MRCEGKNKEKKARGKLNLEKFGTVNHEKSRRTQYLSEVCSEWSERELNKSIQFGCGDFFYFLLDKT